MRKTNKLRIIMHMLKYNYIKFEVKLLQTPELFKLKSAIYYRYFTKSLYLLELQQYLSIQFYFITGFSKFSFPRCQG